ncbi:MAG TPA: OmpH family outer membrane protein [Terriglobia bacterium]|nr:OmpH family outer membrane protein [Terriglobia bacterium]
MRNTVTKFMMLAMVFALPVVLPGQSASTDDAPQKIAVINIQQAIGLTGEGKKALADIQKKYAPKQQDLQQQEKDISALQDQLQNQSSMLSEDEQYRLTRELDTKQRHFKAAQEDARDDYQADTQEAVRQIGKKMVKLIGQYAEQHRFSLVIGDQQVPVYYATKTVDITQEIADLYNQKYPVAAPPSSAATPSSGASAPPPAAKGAKNK